jgi:hypothetical protein
MPIQELQTKLATSEMRPDSAQKCKPLLPHCECRDSKITVRLTAEEVARLTENSHQKAVAETIRELVQKGWKRKKLNEE